MRHLPTIALVTLAGGVLLGLSSIHSCTSRPPPGGAQAGKPVPLAGGAALPAVEGGSIAPAMEGGTGAPACADAERLADGMRSELGDAYTVLVQMPFVIGGRSDDPVRASMGRTLGGSLAALRGQFIRIPPSQPLRVYLFPDAASYQDYCHRRRSGAPPSPYGFFVPSTRSLIMDISTGGGTLVHELVHALMLDDFPDAPKWFDEGFASLFEQSSLLGGRIRGHVNWRLPALQEAIESGKTIPFAELFAATHTDFDGERRALLYAEGRYLCMYLQEKGKLDEFYRKFRENVGRDPTGAATLSEVMAWDLKTGAPEAEIFGWAKGLRR